MFQIPMEQKLQQAIEAHKAVWCSAPFFNGGIIAAWPTEKVKEWMRRILKVHRRMFL
jgi:hypothetical protein